MDPLLKLNGEVRVWARAGAQLELEKIYTAFPELRPSVAASPTPEARSPKPARRAKKRTMSAAQRTAVSKRMRLYWKGRRGTAAAKEARR